MIDKLDDGVIRDPMVTVTPLNDRYELHSHPKMTDSLVVRIHDQEPMFATVKSIDDIKADIIKWSD